MEQFHPATSLPLTAGEGGLDLSFSLMPSISRDVSAAVRDYSIR